jgi:broad specificity polyphosphatase/5'/3'-nucleotidase SurE
LPPQGFRRDTAFSVEPHMSPSGRKFLWIKGGAQHTPTLPGTDAAANLEGYISVTPMRADLTAHDLLAELDADPAGMTTTVCPEDDETAWPNARCAFSLPCARVA